MEYTSIQLPKVNRRFSSVDIEITPTQPGDNSTETPPMSEYMKEYFKYDDYLYSSGQRGVLTYEVTQDNLHMFKTLLKRFAEVEVGDVIEKWDDGGWSELAGRQGLILYRDGKLIGKYTTAKS